MPKYKREQAYYTLTEITKMNLSFGRYQYAPKDLVITLDDNYYVLDGSITYLNMFMEYTKRQSPVIQLGVELPIDTVALIYEMKNEATVSLTIMEYMVDEDGNRIGGSNLFTHTFGLVPMRDQTTYLTSTDINTVKKIDTMRTLQLFEMYLFDKTATNWFSEKREITMKNLTRAEMIIAATYMRGVPARRLIITPPVNNSIVEDVKIPIGTLTNNILTMNTQYGLYPGIPIIFWDLDYFYCICKQNPNLEFKDEDVSDYNTINFVLVNPERPGFQVHGSFDDEEHLTHWVNINKEPSIYDPTTMDSYAKVSTITSVNGVGDVKKTTMDEESSKMVYIYSKNDLTTDQVKNETIFGYVLGIVMSEMSVRFLRPHKDYVFTTDTSYTRLGLDNHIYRLLGWTLNIEREGREKYISQCSMTLYTQDR